MKYRFILLSLALIMLTGCAENPQSEIPVSPAEKITTAETSTSTGTHTTAPATASTTSVPSPEMVERQILEDVEKALHGGSQSLIDNTVEYMTGRVEELSERVLGEITSEEDAVEKARAVLIEIGDSAVIERAEADFVEIDGEKVKYQRRNKPYSVQFFDEYDACWVMPNPPAGITEDGRGVDTPAMPPYVIMRRSDGKVLGIF
ncbi:MAG: hypothetical protein NC489_05270 [Ruminococcus flavefaciens]|nr:hypothetical protein [Ruminococcus flavefaciens]